MTTEVLLLSGDSYSSTLHSTILHTLGIFRTVFDGVGHISIGTTKWTCVGPKNRAGHFAISILQVVRGIKALTLTVVSTKNADLSERTYILYIYFFIERSHYTEILHRHT